MGYEWIGAAIAGAGSAIAGFAGQHPSKSRRYAKELARFNTELAEEMYNKYQSPSAQMEQYKAAGLNPNLVYSQNTGGPAAGAADYDSDSMLPNEGKAIQGMANAISTYQNIRSQQIANSNANLVGDLTKQEIKSKEMDNYVKSSVANYQIESKALQVQDANFKILVRNQADVNKIIAQTESEIEKKKKYIADTKLSGANYDKAMQSVTNMQEELKLLRARRSMIQTQMKEINSLLPFKQNLYQAQAANAAANASITGVRESYIPLDYQRNLINDTTQMDGLFGFGKLVQSYLRSKDHREFRNAEKAVKGMYKRLQKMAGVRNKKK